MLDAIGCALAARSEEFAPRYSARCACTWREGRGRRGVIGFARRLPLRDAALLNGVLTHGLDYDDTHMAGVIHLSVSVLPAVLAGRPARRQRRRHAGRLHRRARGRRADLERNERRLHAHGFHPTGVVGAFASTLAAGRLMGLDDAGLVHAQGAALSMASGSLQFIEDGAWTKRFHPGWAAQAGIAAATFAAHGIQAPQAPYEGRYGFYRCYLGEAEHARIDLSLATAGLKPTARTAHWEIDNIAIKPFPMCHFVHASADAAIALHRRGLDAARIQSVEVRVPAGVVQSVCEPVANKRRPTSDYDAKFSLPYAVASGLLRGRLGLKELAPAAFGDPAALALMDRIDYVEDAESTFPRHYTGEVRVTLDDGSALRPSRARSIAVMPSGRCRTMRCARNIFDNATLYFSRSHAQAVCDQMLGLDRLANVQTLEDAAGARPNGLISR